jgi:toxin ParE1/3/4
MPSKPLDWSKRASAELLRIVEFYTIEASKLIAHDALDSVVSATLAIQKNPLMSREGKKNGTREYIIRRFPYVVVYRIDAHKIQIIRVLHQAGRYFN